MVARDRVKIVPGAGAKVDRAQLKALVKLLSNLVESGSYSVKMPAGAEQVDYDRFANLAWVLVKLAGTPSSFSIEVGSDAEAAGLNTFWSDQIGSSGKVWENGRKPGD